MNNYWILNKFCLAHTEDRSVHQISQQQQSRGCWNALQTQFRGCWQTSQQRRRSSLWKPPQYGRGVPHHGSQ